MPAPTDHRDAWARSKNVALSQVFQATADVTGEITRGGLEIDRLIQKLLHATSFQELYASVERLTEISRSISYNAHGLKMFCDFQSPPPSV